MPAEDNGRRSERRRLLRGLGRLARAVRSERLSREDHSLIPAALRLAASYGEPLPWMRIPGRTVHDRILSAGAEPATVALHPRAAPLLERILSEKGMPPGSFATFEVTLGIDGDLATVRIGMAPVGRLEEAVSERIRPLIEDAARRRRKVLTVATLRPRTGTGAGHVLTVRIPSV